jgi:hypothetical protein
MDEIEMYEYSFELPEMESCADCPCCALTLSGKIICQEQVRRIRTGELDSIPTWCRLTKKKKEADHG